MNKKILIVDDDRMSVNVARSYLSNENFELFVVNDGEEAYKTATKLLPDIVLMDVVMPGIDGYDTCRLLKRNLATESIPIIFVTNLGNTIECVFDAGGCDYVCKPYSKIELITKVTFHLEMQSKINQIEDLNIKLKKTIEEKNAEISALKNRVSES